MSLNEQLNFHKNNFEEQLITKWVHSKGTPVLGIAIPVLGEKLKLEWYVFWLFFEIDLGSATSFKRSRRDLSVDVSEDRSILKNNQNTYYPRFSVIPNTGIRLPETGVLFLLCIEL